MRVIAFDARSGDEVVRSRKDMPHMDDLMVCVRASSPIPALLPLAHSEGRVNVDGAVSEDSGTALSEAQRAGFEKFVIVLRQERSYRKMPQ